MYDLSRKTVYKKAKKKKKVTRIQKYANDLNNNLPQSEVWFQSRWSKDIVQHEWDMYKDKYNYPLGKYIPDVINIGYKYIIEIDGSVHDDEIVQWKDKLKDKYYESKKYKVFRVKAFNESSYLSVLTQVREHIMYVGCRY